MNHSKQVPLPPLPHTTLTHHALTQSSLSCVPRPHPRPHRYEAYSQRLAAALTQAPGAPVPLEELVVVLHAVQSGLVDSVQPSGVGALLQKGLDWLRQHNPQVGGQAGGVWVLGVGVGEQSVKEKRGA